MVSQATETNRFLQKRVRSSNFELLRILSMFLIVMHHYSAQGVGGLTEHALTVNKTLEYILSLGGKIGVNCLVLITGYFMVGTSIKYMKLLKLIFEVFFYSVLCMLVFYGFGLSAFDPKVLKESLFPLTYDMYWFATAYVVLYLLSPFINILIRGLNQKNHLKLILLLVILWSVFPAFTFGQAPGYSSLGWFFLIYLIGAYIKLYPHRLFDNLKITLPTACLSYGVIVLSVIVLDYLGIKNSFFAEHATYLREMNMFPTLLCSVSIFLIFKNLNIGKVKAINTIAASTFGVYLIHNNYFVGPFLWQKVFFNAAYLDSPYLLPHAILTVIIVFCGCTVIDQIRLNLVEKPLFGLLEHKQDAITARLIMLKTRLKKLLKL